MLGIPDDEESSGKTSQRGAVEEKVSEGRISESGPAANACEDITRKEKEFVPAKNEGERGAEGEARSEGENVKEKKGADRSGLCALQKALQMGLGQQW